MDPVLRLRSDSKLARMRPPSPKGGVLPVSDGRLLVEEGGVSMTAPVWSGGFAANEDG